MRATKNKSLTRASTGLAVRAPALAPPDVESVGLFTDAEPVLVPLGDVAERREVAHPVEVHRTPQVVALVLDHAREEVLGVHAHLLPAGVVALVPFPSVATYQPPPICDREASLS